MPQQYKYSEEFVNLIIKYLIRLCILVRCNLLIPNPDKRVKSDKSDTESHPPPPPPLLLWYHQIKLHNEQKPEQCCIYVFVLSKLEDKVNVLFNAICNCAESQ